MTGDRVEKAVPVSVVIPLYHAQERHLRALEASLQAQGAAEVIVVIDDDSSPASIERLLGAVPNLKVIVGDGDGVGMARNRGAAAATQEWITFLDQDDWWPPGFLAALLEGATEDVLGYDNEVYVDEGDGPKATGETLFDQAEWDHGSIDAAEGRLLLDRFPIVKLVLRRRVFAAVGGFRPIYAVEDFDLVWRLVAAGERIALPRSPTGAYLVHPASTTATVRVSHDAFERGQRSWIRIWGGMARSRGLPARVRLGATRNLTKVGTRIVARQVRDRLKR